VSRDPIRDLERLERAEAREGADARMRSLLPADGGRRVSMADVAQRAGVSGQTVSRVVNGSPRVDPVTRERVEAAMAELGYRPHRAARALRTGRTQTIGLVVSTLATVGNSRMLQAVADAAATRGYALVVVTLGAEAGIVAAFERLRDQGVDGVIVLNEASALARDAPHPTDLELVVVDAPLGPDAGLGFGIVQSDHVGGGKAAATHLLSLGHRTVHLVTGPDTSFASAQRERGWRLALQQAGAAEPEILRGDWTAASGHSAAGALGADPGVTAVFAANDQMALGVIRALTDAGRRVPEDVSVVGFDDIADAADYRPPLTTIRQDFDRLGERAVAALVQGIEDGRRRVETVETTLVVRASTAAAARRSAPSGR
jgi:DNA-binding LacI/PurR family transcriptional regulator